MNMLRLTLIYIYLLIINQVALANCVLTGRVCGNGTNNGIADVQVIYGDHGVLTDSLGNFIVHYDSTDNVIQFRHILYEPETLVVDGKTDHVQVGLVERQYTADELTVTAEKPFEIKSPVAARTIGKYRIEMRIPEVVADVLTMDPAIHAKSHYQSPIVMRGLTGHRLLVLRNGNRRFGSYPAGFMSHTVNIYDLERIEIQKGPASVIYGPGAIAGIINLIDKAPFKAKGFNYRVTSTYASNNTETANMVCGGWSNGNLGIKAAYRERGARSYHDAGGLDIKNSYFNDADWFLALGYRFQKQDIQFHIEQHHGGPWGQPLGFSGTRYLYVTTPNENTRDYQLAWHYRSAGWIRDIRITAFFADNDRDQDQLYLNAGTGQPSFREQTYYSDTYYGLRIMPEWKLSGKSILRTGAEYYGFRISTPMTVTDYYEGFEFNNRISHNARSFNLGLYTEWEYNPTPGYFIRGGLRYDRSELYEGSVHDLSQPQEDRSETGAPSATLAMQLPTGKNSRLKINLARAFRMPTPQEMFSNTYTANGVLYGNPELRSEHSWNADLVWQYHCNLFEFELSPFYWLLNDMIDKIIVYDLPGLNYEYVNIGRARIWGGEVSMSSFRENLLSTGDRLSIHLATAYTNGTDLTRADGGSGHLPLDHIPPMQFVSELDYEARLNSKVKGNFNLSVHHCTAQNRLPETAYRTPAYTLASVAVGTIWHTTHGNMALRLVVNNLLNAQYYAFQSFVPGKGRDYRLFWSFNKG